MATSMKGGFALTLKRFRSTFKLLMRSKLAIVGLILLIMFAFAAIAAPLLTPYDPEKSIVAGAAVPPDWTKYLPGSEHYSENMVFSSDPGFSIPASANGWDIIGPTNITQFIHTSYNPDGFPGDSGSMDINYSRTTPFSSSSGQSVYTFDVNRQFRYPYSGPPIRFVAGVAIRVLGSSSAEPVDVRLVMQKVGVSTTKWVLYSSPMFNTTDSGWTTPTIGLDSSLKDFRDLMGLQFSSFSPAEIIFPTAGDYRYSVEVTLKDLGTSTTKNVLVRVDQLSLKLYGSVYGLFGSDGGGRDLFTQFIYGSRISLAVGLVSAFVGISLGLVVGLLAGFLGKMVDETLMRFTDMMLVIPGLPLLIVLVAILGPSFINLILVLGLLGWMGFARVVRSQVLSLKERPFIEASRAAGAGSGHILLRHIMPNIVSLTYVNLALTVPGSILGEAALSFLGLGDPTTISWGRILNNAETSGGLSQWFWVIPPGLGIAAVSLSFVLIGFALDELFNPKLRLRR